MSMKVLHKLVCEGLDIIHRLTPRRSPRGWSPWPTQTAWWLRASCAPQAPRSRPSTPCTPRGQRPATGTYVRTDTIHWHQNLLDFEFRLVQIRLNFGDELVGKKRLYGRGGKGTAGFSSRCQPRLRRELPERKARDKKNRTGCVGRPNTPNGQHVMFRIHEMAKHTRHYR